MSIAKAVREYAEATKRDELVVATRNAQSKVEHCVRVLNRRQKAMAMLPQESAEYKMFAVDVNEDKWVLVSALRNYEEVRKELSKLCKACQLAGDIFLPGYELLEILAEKS